jgi:hypothetical protein
MITYIYHKDSTLWAFEGPEKPPKDSIDTIVIEWKEKMRPLMESSLPVVNEVRTSVHGLNNCLIIDLDGAVEIKPSETLPLPGWGLEKLLQWHPVGCDGKWQNTNEWYFMSVHPPCGKREAYRLVRSEPEKKHIILTFKSGSLWHGEYQVQNPEVIPFIVKSFDKIIRKDGRTYHHFNDGDQITLPEGYGIELHLKGCEHAHSEGKKEGWNEAIQAVTELLMKEHLGEIVTGKGLISELQKLKR